MVSPFFCRTPGDDNLRKLPAALQSLCRPIRRQSVSESTLHRGALRRIPGGIDDDDVQKGRQGLARVSVVPPADASQESVRFRSGACRPSPEAETTRERGFFTRRSRADNAIFTSCASPLRALASTRRRPKRAASYITESSQRGRVACMCWCRSVPPPVQVPGLRCAATLVQQTREQQLEEHKCRCYQSHRWIYRTSVRFTVVNRWFPGCSTRRLGRADASVSFLQFSLLSKQWATVPERCRYGRRGRACALPAPLCASLCLSCLTFVCRRMCGLVHTRRLLFQAQNAAVSPPGFHREGGRRARGLSAPSYQRKFIAWKEK